MYRITLPPSVLLMNQHLRSCLDLNLPAYVQEQQRDQHLESPTSVILRKERKCM